MQLIGAEKYAIDRVPHLEKSVEAQITSRSQDLDADLTLLRFYQLQPALAKPELVAQILIKAIMQLPQPDYKICIHLISERLQSEEPIATVMRMAQHLETTRFQDFWILTVSCKDILNTVPGFYDAVRAFILHVISMSMVKVTKRQLADALRMDSKAIEALITSREQSQGWRIIRIGREEVIVLRSNNDGVQVAKTTQKTIAFDEISPVLKVGTVGL